MANYKKRRVWGSRNRCHMCKYWKHQAFHGGKERYRPGERRRLLKSEADWHDRTEGH